MTYPGNHAKIDMRGQVSVWCFENVKKIKSNQKLYMKNTVFIRKQAAANFELFLYMSAI